MLGHHFAPTQENFTQVVARLKASQVDELLTRGARGAFGAQNPEAQAAAVTHGRRIIAAMVRAYLGKVPGGSPKQFLLELRNGRAPTAGFPEDTERYAQQELASLIEHDPSLLDGV